MRRILSVLATVVLVTAGVGQADARAPRALLPGGIRAVSAKINFPDVGVYKSHKPIVHTFTSRTQVAELARMVDSLHPVSGHVVCPAMVILGPTLTLAFRAGRAGSSRVLAEAEVQVVLGSGGHSGDSPCYPIRFSVHGGAVRARLSATFVRAVGRLMGVKIS